jgi:fatty-acyl-CoA synthase
MQHCAQDPDRLSLLLFTSGTSGRSKGVMLSERNIHQTAVNFGALTRVSNTSVFLCDAPMFHVMGMTANLRPVLLQGGTVLLSDGFNAQRTLQRLCDPGLGVTHYVGVPQMIEMLRREPAFDPASLQHMTALVSGGAPHPVRDIKAWLAAGLPLVLGYGMTEAGTVFGMSVEREVIGSHAGAAGVAMPGMQVRLVDDAGCDCAPDQPGELLLRGDSITRGYWRNPEETARSIDAEGWFATGDIARCDEQGFFWILDRKKDMFICGGENVYPAEIETLLIGYPGVAECALVGVPDARWGEVGVLAVVWAVEAVAAEQGILEYLGQHVARYKLPQRVVTLRQLPRTATGKLQKTQLRSMLKPDATEADKP